MLTIIDLRIKQRTDQYFTLAFSAAGEPLDLSGSTVEASIADHEGGPPVAVFDCDMTEALSGIVKFNLPAVESAKCTKQTMAWDAVLVDEAGKRARLCQGSVRVFLGITGGQ